MNNLEIYTELTCRYLINFLFISSTSESDYLRVNNYYENLLKSNDFNKNYFDLLSVIKPSGFSSETVDYLINKEDYEDIFFEYFSAKRIDSNYFFDLNSLIHKVFLSSNLNSINLLLKEAKDYLIVFDSNIINETGKLNLNLKKSNLLNLLNLEFNYQIAYFLHYKKESKDCGYLFNKIKDCLINNGFLIREILKINNFSIFNMSLNSVKQTKEATLVNENKIRGGDVAIKFFKKYLLDRSIIDSENTLIALSKKAVNETIKFYQEKHKIDLERRFINKTLNRWLAKDFYDFKNANGIKVNNKVIIYIYKLKSMT